MAGNPNWQNGGASPNPGGKPKGAKDRFGHTRSAKRAVLDLLDRFGNDTVLSEATLGARPAGPCTELVPPT